MSKAEPSSIQDNVALAQSRQAFESRTIQAHPSDFAEFGAKLFERNGEQYQRYWVQKDWETWQSAQQAKVVSIRLPLIDEMVDESGRLIDVVDLNALRASMRAAGIQEAV